MLLFVVDNDAVVVVNEVAAVVVDNDVGGAIDVVFVVIFVFNGVAKN